MVAASGRIFSLSVIRNETQHFQAMVSSLKLLLLSSRIPALKKPGNLLVFIKKKKMKTGTKLAENLLYLKTLVLIPFSIEMFCVISFSGNGRIPPPPGELPLGCEQTTLNHLAEVLLLCIANRGTTEQK